MDTKKTSGNVVNYINVAPNNGLGGGIKKTTNMNSEMMDNMNKDMMEGSGGSIYQPFETNHICSSGPLAVGKHAFHPCLH